MARHYGFLILKINTVAVIAQGVGPMHDPRVDTRHDKRRNPAASDRIIGNLHLRLRDRELMVLRTQAVRVLKFAAQIGVAHGFFDHVNHAGDGAAGRPAFHADHPHVDPRTCLAELFQCVALKEVHAQIGRDRVKPTAMHNSCAAFYSIGLVP